MATSGLLSGAPELSWSKSNCVKSGSKIWKKQRKRKEELKKKGTSPDKTQQKKEVKKEPVSPGYHPRNEAHSEESE